MKKFLPAIAANISAAFSEILLMASAAWLIASAALQPPLSSLSVGITLVRTAGIARAVLRYFDRFLTHKIIFKYLDDLREELFKSAALTKKFSSGEFLHELIITADLLKDFLPRVVLPLSTAALTTILLTYFLIAPLGIFAGILPAIFFAVIILSIKFKVETADDSEYRAKLLDFNGGKDELKIYGVKPALKILNRTAENFGTSQLKIQTRQLNFDTFIKIFIAAGNFLILLKLGAVVDKINLTVWALILFVAQEIFSAVPAAVRSFRDIGVKGYRDIGVKGIVKNFSTDFAVEFRNVNFGYDFPIIKNFNLQIERGEKVLIVGESGAGKTTLLYLMTKILQPDSGEIFIGGKVAAATSTNYIFSQSIRFNFEIYATDAEIFNALKICQLENFEIDTEIGEDAAKLSGGERGRLQIALALAKNPDILILDEPTAGLDKILAEKLIAALVDDCNKKNRTLIIITHDLNLNWKKINL
ncbi:MAG: ATP-binding cassette domain-containing protein [Selenomonadaceae bacterium]|nr:ATP-binding cassette domain-containing protein [Selenomonadaceae bacterium]